MNVYISFSDVALIQGRPTFFSRGPTLLFQKFRGPKFSLTLSSSSQTKVFRWISWWSPKKRSSLRFDRFFLPKTRWRPKKKKKVFTQVLIIFFCQKASEHTHKKRSFRWNLWDSPKSKYRRNSRTRFCNSQRQRGSISQPTDAETFGACHFKTFGGPLVGRPCLNWWVPINCISKISFFACCDYSAYIVSIKLFGEHLFRMKGV